METAVATNKQEPAKVFRYETKYGDHIEMKRTGDRTWSGSDGHCHHVIRIVKGSIELTTTHIDVPGKKVVWGEAVSGTQKVLLDLDGNPKSVEFIIPPHKLLPNIEDEPKKDKPQPAAETKAKTGSIEEIIIQLDIKDSKDRLHSATVLGTNFPSLQGTLRDPKTGVEIELSDEIKTLEMTKDVKVTKTYEREKGSLIRASYESKCLTKGDRITLVDFFQLAHEASRMKEFISQPEIKDEIEQAKSIWSINPM